jgi:superfamily II DNA helicase RecQ
MLNALPSKLGYRSFRRHQKEIVRYFALERKDVVVVLPTSAGKSALYQMSPFLRRHSSKRSGESIVAILPLAVILNGHAEELKEMDKVNYCIYSRESGSKRGRKAMRNGKFQVILCYAEDATSPGACKLWKEMGANGTLCGFAVDEAHLIRQWGQVNVETKTSAFRDSYDKLSTMRSSCPNIPFLLLSASITSSTLKFISQSIELREGMYISFGTFSFIHSFSPFQIGANLCLAHPFRSVFMLPSKD